MNRSASGGAARAQQAAREAERRAPPADQSRGTRFAGFAANSYDAEARTVEAVLSVGAPVRRWSFTEELEISEAAIDLSRVLAGQCRLLNSHNQWDVNAVLGSVVSARVENGQLIGLLSFAETEAGRNAEAMVARGELKGISIGYRVTAWKIVEVDDHDHETWRAASWELLEASLVAVPADANAGVRSAVDQPGAHGAPANPQEDDMNRSQPGGAPAPAASASASAPAPAPAPAAPAVEARAEPAAAQPPAASPAQPDANAVRAAPALGVADVLSLTDQARSLGVEEQARAALALEGATRASVSDAILAAAAARQAGNTGQVPAGAAARAGADEVDHRRAGVRGAILAQLRGGVGEVEEVVRPYMRHSLSELAAVSLGERDMPRTAAERIEVYGRAFHTTSDFPALLGGALNARLEENYRVATPVYRRIARQMTFTDFRAHDVLRPGDFPQLQKVNETGEIKFGTFGEKKETVAVVAYGIQFGLSRQLLVNDNLGAIDQILASQGTAVGLFEEITFFAMKGTTGPTLVEDGKAVFHTDHKNLAGAGAAISTTSLSQARAALRKQTNLSGQAMGLAPKILLVSPDKETEAEQIVAPLVAADSAKVNPFSGKLEIVVGGQLTGNAWELYVDPAFGTNWTWGLLDGFTAPRLKVEDVFGQQGAKVSLEHDFGCGAIDYRFGYRNPGA